MKKVQRPLSMTDGEERKHVLDYTHVDLHYVEDQRKNLLSKFNSLNQELSSCKDEISDLKKVIEKWTSNKVTLDQLLTEQVPGNIVRTLGGRGKKKDTISSKEVLFSKAAESPSKTVPKITSDSESECGYLKPLPPLPKLTGAEPIGTLTNVLDKSLAVKAPKKKNVDSSTEKLFLTLMEEDYLKRSVWYLDSGCSRHMTGVKQYLHRYSKESGPKVVFGDNSLGDTEGYGSMNCNEITFTRGGAVNITCYTQNRSIIVKRHGNTAYDVFRRTSPDISYFHVFGCHVHIHNHRDHLGKSDAKADDGFFLGYSLVAKAFRVFNIKRQEMEETNHVTFNEDDEAISKSSTEGDEINFNENRSFPDDEFLIPRRKVSQCSSIDDCFPYVPSHDSLSTNNISIPDNATPSETPILQYFNSSHEHPEFTIADDHHVLNEHDDSKSAEDLEIVEDQVSTIIDLWSREKHIELVNILGEPWARVTTRSRIKDSEAASAHECLYVNFLSEIKPKKLIEALEE
ncbi:retrovirus-related pol polyprotein from transposon TNT 1-94 [Tanacetum coccineum]|uniref:Retrovirus-related pol polyprotein from transposon TNT 1-94 n=1 Tax=Tanacetum coccineum TaxID=301880 RepID=A0ABQ4YVX6_9ASTR